MSGQRRRPAYVRSEAFGSCRNALHLTRRENLQSIERLGLVPSIGPLAKVAGITEPAVHMFSSCASFELSLAQWLQPVLWSGGEGDGGGDLALLTVDVSWLDLRPNRGELVCEQTIPATCIEVVDIDLASVTSVDLVAAIEEHFERRANAVAVHDITECEWRRRSLSERHSLMLETHDTMRTYAQRRTRTGETVTLRRDVAAQASLQSSLFPAPARQFVPKS